MKIVLDTNVIVSAFLWAGRSSKILGVIEDGKIIVYSCFEQVSELKGVLSRSKFKPFFQKTMVSPGSVASAFAGKANLIRPTNKLNVIKEDKDDNIILSCAIEAETDYLITGDKHLLSLKKYQQVKIISPRKFLELF